MGPNTPVKMLDSVFVVQTDDQPVSSERGRETVGRAERAPVDGMAAMSALDDVLADFESEDWVDDLSGDLAASTNQQATDEVLRRLFG